jgi:hypothetical protein
VAPKGQPQGDLFINTLEEALRNPAKAKDLERDTGLTREQVEQFTSKYKKRSKPAPAGPGRQIDLKDQDQKTAQPSANLPGLDASIPFSSQSRRSRGTAAQDQFHDNVEGIRFQPPPELRAKWEGYNNTLMKVVAPKRAPAPGTKSGK